jgi:hypothetical protein
VKGKIDKLNDLYSDRAHREFKQILMSFVYKHNSDAALWAFKELHKESYKFYFAIRAHTVYERLEVHDIIRGHKRAWSESKP